MTSAFPRIPFSRLNPLAACLAAALGLSNADAKPLQRPHTNDIQVTNCNDSGPGSLRDAVASANFGDYIDMSFLICRISLFTGSIRIAKSLTMFGLDASLLTIDAQSGDRVFYQYIPGLYLNLYDMTLTNGRSDSQGGCLATFGSALLVDVVISSCKVDGNSASSVKGGGVFAQGDLSMIGSSVVDNEVHSAQGNAQGGGAYAGGRLYMDQSVVSGNEVDSVVSGNVLMGGGVFSRGALVTETATISDNLADAGAGSSSLGGGATSYGRAQITCSTISGNTSGDGGGLALLYPDAAPSKIFDSTISGNRAAVRSSGGVFAYNNLIVANSTIAFNTETVSAGAGLRLDGGSASYLELRSSIIAHNTGGSSPVDVGGYVGTVSGGNNLVMVSGISLPPDTLRVDPRLLPLYNNGGFTATHALSANSPAINTGSNYFNLKTDERRNGFARVVGANADIGAFEYDPERVFTNGFD